MHEPVPHPHRVAPTSLVKLDRLPTTPPEGSTKAWKATLDDNTRRISRRQEVLYADGRFSVLCVVQGMDGSGKDSAIKKVFTGVNPTGCRVTSFKRPSTEELAHDFLWRTQAHLPARGMIGVFNRSWYEEVLVVRVHPELLAHARLPSVEEDPDVWARRFSSIRDHEAHLARNGTVVLKFFLHLSRDEQRRRLQARLADPEKHWKFDPRDLTERAHWDAYQRAWQELLPETSRPWAPWYAIPADDKDYARAAISSILADTLEALPIRFPDAPGTADDIAAWRQQLEDDHG